MKAVGELEHLVLLALLRLGDSAYGVSIRQEIEHRTGRDVPTGALYTVLGRLEEKGLVCGRAAEVGPDRGGRRRKYYTLEPSGERALAHSHTILRKMAAGLEKKIEALALAAEQP